MQEASSKSTVLFGPFALDRLRKQLLRGSHPVALGSRSFELLTILVDRAPAFVSREELVAHVWPHTIVEETSLRVHMSALRRALGDGESGARYIVNAPGRGYSFVARIELGQPNSESAVEGPVSRSETVPAKCNLPARLSHVFGRADILSTLSSSLEQRRMVSIVGPGGMGKTTVALALAETRLGQHEHGVWFVDLAPLSDGSRVPMVLASVLGISVLNDSFSTALQAYLCDKQILLILDNCEHVVDAAAAMAEALLRVAPRLQILATSREPLEVEGEWVHRLAPLTTPAPAENLRSEEAIGYSAIQLFVERASANSDDFELNEQNLPAVRHLCRQLDGMPLAIELAAARVDSLGVHGLVTQLDDHFQLTLRGRRTAWPRHQTLMSMLSWSHSLLGPNEVLVLRRLSLFKSWFSLQAACSLVASDDVSPVAVVEAIATLTRRSLLSADTTRRAVAYRLLYTTRSYATHQLERSEEFRRFACRHAEYFRGVLQRANVDLYDMPRIDWLSLNASTMDDVLAALDWSFGNQGDDLIGISLVIAALDLVHELGLWDEYRPRLLLALERLRALGEDRPQQEIMLCAALCAISGVTQEPLPNIDDVVERTLALAEVDQDSDRRTEALFDVCVSSFGRGEYELTKRTALKVRQHAGDPDSAMSVLLGGRFLALSEHYLGNHDSSREHALRVLHFSGSAGDRRYHRQVPRGVSMNILRARIFWLEGLFDQALATALEAVGHAEADHAYALCQALAMGAIPVALWRGDDELAVSMFERLATSNQRCFHSYWTPWIAGFKQVLAARGLRVGADGGKDPAMRESSSAVVEDLLGTLEGSLISPGSIVRLENAKAAWCAPELLRVQAEVLMDSSEPGAVVEAEMMLERSCSMAGSQGALAWELRTSMSLARLMIDQGRLAPARRLVAEVLDRIVEGAETRDVKRARHLLAYVDQVEADQGRTSHG